MMLQDRPIQFFCLSERTLDVCGMRLLQLAGKVRVNGPMARHRCNLE
jgi:hypothetical protein